MRATGHALGWAGRRGLGPRWDTGPRSQFASSAVNGLIGDRIARERPVLQVRAAARVGGADVAVDRDALASAYSPAAARVAFFLHGLSENETFWNRGRERVGTTYAATVSDLSWTPVMLRVNTGLAVREGGVVLAARVRDLLDRWPTEVDRVALVGHSMGGLLMRSALSVRGEGAGGWPRLVTDVITLGTPHLGAPLARLVGDGSRRLSALPETAASGRFLDWRSAGVRDLVEGLPDLAPAPGVRHLVVSGAVAGPLGRLVGDLLVLPDSAQGRAGSHELFPGADVLHLPGADHFDLLNHARVHQALRSRLA